jgi:hypothetical protein
VALALQKRIIFLPKEIPEMPQPDSSRKPLLHEQWSEADPWPAVPASPRRRVAPPARSVAPTEAPAKDGRSAADPDGNQEQEREAREGAQSSRTPSTRTPSTRTPSTRTPNSASPREDKDEEAASRRFSADDELEDTWPNIAGRDLED